MSSSYSGNSSGLNPRTDAITITTPSDGDDLLAASASIDDKKLGDFLKMVQDTAAFLGLDNTFTAKLLGNPTKTTALLNRLTAKQQCKAWALITTDGAGGTTLVEGVNVASVAIVGAVVRVTFAQAMADANYAPVFGAFGLGGSAPTYMPGVNDATSDNTKMDVVRSPFSGSSGFQSVACKFSFALFGTQT